MPIRIFIAKKVLFQIIAFIIVFSTNILSINDLFYEIQKDSIKHLEPLTQYKTENQLITSILTRYHFKEFDINDSLSEVIFSRYLDALDHGKNYLLASDIRQLQSHKYQLDDYILNGDVNFFYNAFDVYLERLNQRLVAIEKLLEKEFDYSLDENFNFDREKSEWAKDESELDELWRKRLKNDALTHKLNGKDWDFIQKTLRKRYKNLSDFLNQYNSEDVFQLAMNSFTQSIDPHTNYLSPVTSDNFKIDMSLSLEGIGARLQTVDDYTKVAEIIPGGPADISGLLKADDRIVAVAQGEDGEFEDIIGWRITDAVKLIRGPKGTRVRLQIIKAGSDLNSNPIEISLIRDKVKIEDQAAKGEVIETENENDNFKIGVIKIPKFYSDFEGQRNGDGSFKSTTRDVKKIIDSLLLKNIDGIIIDLRDDGGGSLQEAIELTGLFIKDGPIVQVKHSDGNIEISNDPDPSIIYDGPLAVMVNRFSASASEIFAGAIQDYGRGLIIGEQTFGKGTVQNLIDLNRLSSNRKMDLGQVKLTIAKFYRVTGGSTQSLGVIPDISFPSFVDPEEFGENAEPNSLPWDEIKSAKFKRFSDLSGFIPIIKEKFNNRINSNTYFVNLLEDIAVYKENKKKSIISLNEMTRKLEKEEEDKRKLDRTVNALNDDEDDLLEGEVPTENTKSEDFLLKEASNILTDFILLSAR